MCTVFYRLCAVLLCERNGCTFSEVGAHHVLRPVPRLVWHFISRCHYIRDSLLDDPNHKFNTQWHTVLTQHSSRVTPSSCAIASFGTSFSVVSLTEAECCLPLILSRLKERISMHWNAWLLCGIIASTTRDSLRLAGRFVLRSFHFVIWAKLLSTLSFVSSWRHC